MMGLIKFDKKNHFTYLHHWQQISCVSAHGASYDHGLGLISSPERASLHTHCADRGLVAKDSTIESWNAN